MNIGAPLIILILILYMLLGHKMEMWKRKYNHISSILSIHESVPAILLGLILSLYPFYFLLTSLWF